MVEARCWKVYHGTTEQLLAVYPGTSTADALSAVRELFGFGDAAPLRFRNADGIPVALSSQLPDKVSLHVAVEAGAPQPPTGSAPTAAGRSLAIDLTGGANSTSVSGINCAEDAVCRTSASGAVPPR